MRIENEWSAVLILFCILRWLLGRRSSFHRLDRTLLLTALYSGTATAYSSPTGPFVDATPSSSQKGYSPENSEATTNPPPFIWVPAPTKNARYLLQIASSDDFPVKDTKTFVNLQRSAFVPNEPLPIGKWFWRYGIYTQNGTMFSRPRWFSITEKTARFDFPNWKEVSKIVPLNHPRLFFGRDKLQQTRQLASTDLKESFDFLEASCDREVGKTLVNEPSFPPEGNERGPWKIEVIQTTRPAMDLMEACALVYLIRGNARFGFEAKRRIMHFFSWDPNGATNLRTDDEPAMWMMMRGVRAYDWIYDLFSSSEREDIERVIKIRALQFLSLLQEMPFESNPYSSHSGRILGFLGECALVFFHEWSDAIEWLEYVTLLYYTSFPAWGGDDGGWQEGPGYWGDYMRYALHFVVAFREASGVDLSKKPFFQNTPYYGLYAAPPYHQHSPFGDGSAAHAKGLGNLMYIFSSLTQNPYARWYSEESKSRIGRDLLSIVTYDRRLAPRFPGELPRARIFPSIGLASIHTALGDTENDVSFLIRSSPLGSISHSHADQNAYTIEAFGRGLAIASGYYPWDGSPHHSQWTRSTKSVNSLLVNGNGQVWGQRKANGRITLFRSLEKYDYVETEAAPAYMGLLDRFRRHVIHLHPRIFVFFDDIKSKYENRYQWLLHAYNEIDIDERTQTLTITNNPAVMTTNLLLPTHLIFSQSNKFTPPPESTGWENSWHFSASTLNSSKSMQFLSVTSIHRTDEEDPLRTVKLIQCSDAIGAYITTTGSSDIIIFRTNETKPQITCGGITSTARIFGQGVNQNGDITRSLSIQDADEK